MDHVNFFKSNDISEMVYVHEDNESDVKLEIAKRAFEVKKSTVEVKKVMRLRANSGITPPTQYIRQRYFRRRPVMPQEELKVVEQELQKIRQDIIAIPRSADEPEDKKKLKRKYNKKFQWYLSENSEGASPLVYIVWSNIAFVERYFDWQWRDQFGVPL